MVGFLLAATIGIDLHLSLVPNNGEQSVIDQQTETIGPLLKKAHEMGIYREIIAGRPWLSGWFPILHPAGSQRQFPIHLA
jgi:hypothetical protein